MKPAVFAASTTHVPPASEANAAPVPVAVFWLGAEQVTVAPPPLPAQVHDHGEAMGTGDATPALQRFVAGLNALVTPFALPQAPTVTAA
jgi:hypothetical protein